ncbi:putative purine permease 4 [Canna indica]|uniref:Purine permease 4 n=1 Tax=Canna indica TaxID=4628 RepID=A0AAQ3JNH9_9LILI|nr:putative purine permease 4 [Canna indica]
MYAVYLPLAQIVYRGVTKFRMVMEMQVVMEAAAIAFALVGVAAGGGFEQMRREAAAAYDLGKAWYWVTIAASIVGWQLCFMGTVGEIVSFSLKRVKIEIEEAGRAGKRSTPTPLLS